MNEFEQLLENDKQISELMELNEKLFDKCFEVVHEVTDPNPKAYTDKNHKAIELKAKHFYRCAVGEYYQTKHCIYKRIK